MVSDRGRSEVRAVTKLPTAVGQVITVLAPGEALLPQRRNGAAIDRIGQLAELLATMLGDGSTIEELAFRKSLEARAPASIKALANDLDC